MRAGFQTTPMIPVFDGSNSVMDRLDAFLHHKGVMRRALVARSRGRNSEHRSRFGGIRVLCETLPTQILVERINEGDNNAREALYKRYLPIVVFMARAKLGPSQNNRIEAEDVAQSVLMNSLSGLENFEYRHEGAFRHLLSHRVKNKIIDKIRQAKAKKNDPGAAKISEETNIPDEAASPASQIVSNKEQYELLCRALDSLKEENEKYYDIIEQRLIQKLTFPQIGDLLDINADAARMRFDRAIPRLIKIFHSLGGDNG